MSVSRRTFLRTLVVSAAGVGLLSACGDDEGTPRDPVDAGGDGTPDVDGDAGADVGADAESDTDAPDAAPDVVELPVEIDPSWFPQSVASGDPKPDSIVLWTRVVPPAGGADVALVLTLATDEAFTQTVAVLGREEATLVARAADDGCLKVRVTDLMPDTVYYYRFAARDGDVMRATRTGRTRTAPLPDAERAVRFAFVSCQDYAGVYYNPYKRLVTEELDFVVHLGDYVHETTGDPEFQQTETTRKIVFGDEAGAIPLGDEEAPYFAAASLDNYRDLYRTHRSDPWLQAVHERFAVIALWDDHEFSNDCWGANGTYTNGREDELDVARRQNATQAWVEYMPVDYLDDPDFSYDRSIPPPDDIRIWRDLRYGANLHLVATDLRSYRPDHLIAEDEHPGSIALTEPELAAQPGGVPENATPYVDLQEDDEAAAVMRAWAMENNYPRARVRRYFSWARLQDIREAAGMDRQNDALSDALPRGLSFADVGKASLYSSVGSRYLSVVGTFDRIAAAKFSASDGASERLMGETQRAWFLDTMQSSDARWKVWCNEFCLFAKIVDVSGFERLPPTLKQRFYLSVEDWAGALNERDALIDALADVGGVVAITGDIHAFFASTPSVRDNPSRRIPEFVTSAVSSGTYERLLINTANSDEGLREAGAAALALLVPELLADRDTRPNPDLAHAVLNQHGYAVAEVDAAAWTVTFVGYPQNLATQDLSTDVARAAATVQVAHLQVRAGSTDLWKQREGGWERWDSVDMVWVPEV